MPTKRFFARLTPLLLILWFVGPIAEPRAETYVPLGQAIVVNLKDDSRPRFMQINAQAAVSSSAAASRIQTHMPVLRHEVIMMLSGKSWEDAQDIEIREQWREQLLERLRGRMQELTGQPTIDGLYFSDLIVQ